MTVADDRPTVALTCGPAGAGKTTWALARVAQGWDRLSTDEEVWARGHHDHRAPQEVLDAIDRDLRTRLADAVRAGRDVVVDLSFSTRAIRAEYRQIAVDAGARCTLVWFEVPLPELRRRLALRDLEPGANAVRLDERTLTAYVEGFERPGPDEGFDEVLVLDVAQSPERPPGSAAP